VEFVFLAVLLMVPLVYVLLTVFRVQGASYAVSGAAREAGRVFVASADESGAADRARTAAAIALADNGIRLQDAALSIVCSADPCLTPGARVEVALAYDVGLPLVPRVLGRAPASVQVSSSHLQVVDRFRAGAR
jgi:hypothetical protein